MGYRCLQPPQTWMIPHQLVLLFVVGCGITSLSLVSAGLATEHRISFVQLPSAFDIGVLFLIPLLVNSGVNLGPPFPPRHREVSLTLHFYANNLALCWLSLPMTSPPVVTEDSYGPCLTYEAWTRLRRGKVSTVSTISRREPWVWPGGVEAKKDLEIK